MIIPAVMFSARVRAYLSPVVPDDVKCKLLPWLVEELSQYFSTFPDGNVSQTEAAEPSNVSLNGREEVALDDT